MSDNNVNPNHYTLSSDWIGTVSHGTMLSTDLAPSFLAVIDAAADEGVIREGYAEDLRGEWLDMSQDDKEGEKGSEFVNELFTILDDMAPHGCYFGSLEGDGSDYGFWLVDTEDDFEDYDDEPVNPYGAPGGLLDELVQSERMLGTI